MESIKYETLINGENPKVAIIGLHGWKGNSKSFQIIAKQMKLENVEWFFLEAPYIIDDKPNERSWSYEISPNVWEMDKPTELLTQFFNNIVFAKYESQNVFVIGFSQGALVCFEHSLFIDKPLAGIFPVAGFFREPNVEKQRISQSQKNTQILIGHGIDDDIVPIESSEFVYDTLKNQGANVELFKFNGKHKIGISYLNKVKNIIKMKTNSK